MKFLFSLILICFTSVSCSPDRTTHAITNDEASQLKEFKNLDAKNRLKITDENEPGEKLKLCLTIRDKATKQIQPNQKIHFYHTSSAGEYEPKDPNDESTARLNGTVFTDLKGRVFVETILPGDYGSSPDNRHIHTTIFGANPLGYDIHFKQYTGLMGKNFIKSSDQHFLADLKRDTDGTLIMFLTLEPKNIGN